MWTHMIWKYFTKKCQNRAHFQDVTLNFSNILCVLPLTSCMAVELSMSRFFLSSRYKSHYLSVQCYEFIFTQYSFCKSFRHSLLTCQVDLGCCLMNLDCVTSQDEGDNILNWMNPKAKCTRVSCVREAWEMWNNI